MKDRIKLFIPLIVFVILAVIFWIVLSDENYDPQALPSALLDKPVPEFTLTDLQGNSISKKDILGEAALVNVWATWCISCRVEHAYLNDLAEQGVKIIGLNYKDEDSKAIEWLEKLGNPYQQSIYDVKGKLGLDLGVYGAPETYIIDKEGVVRFKHVGVVDGNVWLNSMKPVYERLK